MLTLVYRDIDNALQFSQPAPEAFPELLALVKPGGFFWLDLQEPTVEEAALLDSFFHFHKLEIEDALEEVHHPKLDEATDHLFLILHSAPALHPSATDSSTEVDLFIGEHWLVTHHHAGIRAIDQAHLACRHHQVFLTRSPGFLAYQIIDRLMETYDPLLTELELEIGALEDEVFADPGPAVLQRLFALKRSVLEVRRLVTYQREVLGRLSRVTNAQIGPELSIYFRDVWDHLTSVHDQAEQMRDELMGVMDAYLSQVSNRLNEIMKFLTAISTLFIPLNFITGFFGMNFDFMPLLHSEWGFSAMILIMMGSALLGRWYFKRRGWL